MTTQADHQVYDYGVPFVLFCMLFKNLCAWIYFINSVFDSHFSAYVILNFKFTLMTWLISTSESRKEQ